MGTRFGPGNVYARSTSRDAERTNSGKNPMPKERQRSVRPIATKVMVMERTVAMAVETLADTAIVAAKVMEAIILLMVMWMGRTRVGALKEWRVQKAQQA